MLKAEAEGDDSRAVSPSTHEEVPGGRTVGALGSRASGGRGRSQQGGCGRVGPHLGQVGEDRAGGVPDLGQLTFKMLAIRFSW